VAVRAAFAHVDLVARDWKRLAAFYEEIFGCIRVPPERRLSGAWLDAATGLPGAAIRGVHLRLPGMGEGGPTLEVLQYAAEAERPPTATNRPGFGHIAFSVDDVQAALDSVVAAGGGPVGDVVTSEIPGAGAITFVYATDPEGNVIELQRWG